MPALESIGRDGAFGVMRSVFPYNSAVAWTSLSTGVVPARHGIFDFVWPRPGQYHMRVLIGDDRRVPALWTHASAAGARVAVVNIPTTFPAEPVNGLMISGMDAPSLEARSVHPPGLLDEMQSVEPDYRIVSKAHLRATQGDFDAAERELIDVVRARAALTAHLAGKRDMDLVMVNLEATDGAHHFFWQHFDPSHPRHDAVRSSPWTGTIGRVYQAVDEGLARIIDAYGPDTVFVVSDHGGGPSSDWVLFMNDWLSDEGFLKIRRRPLTRVARFAHHAARSRLSLPMRRRLQPLLGGRIERAKALALYGDVDWARSVAYAPMIPAVLLNEEGRRPEGIVKPADRDGIIDRISERARALRLPAGESVFTGVGAPAGPDAGSSDGPDLELEPRAGLDVRGRNESGAPGFLRRLSDVGGYAPSGVHTPDGLVVAAGTGIARTGRVADTDIHQVAPSVLSVMGVTAPPMDGDPFPFVTSRFETRGVLEVRDSDSSADLAGDEEAEVLERLRGLGYVD